jgi:TatA/E family protein of Tat protein translocase
MAQSHPGGGMFGSIGLPELLLIFVIALLLFGPRKLPDIGKSLGKAMGEFRRASNDLRRSLEEEVAADELRAAKREIQDLSKPAPPSEAGTTSDSNPEATEPKPPATEPSHQGAEPKPPATEPK